MPADPSQPKPRLLVADDQQELLTLMREALEHEGYDVRTVLNGQLALDAIRADPPDIAVIDLWMPEKNGFDVCSELKSDPSLQHLPIIILSGASSRDNKIQGMDLGADDFVTKPVELMELLARIRMILRRSQQDLDANPLTRLPGNHSIQKRIEGAISRRSPLAVLYLDLNNFKAYNDAYGFDSGDKVIQATGKVLLSVVRSSGKSEDFLGHIGGDDFIIVTAPERMEALARLAIDEFDKLSPTFYKEEDRKRGKIISTDRQGKTAEFPLLSIAVGVCHNALKPLSSYGQVSQIGAELKKFAKRNPHSSYVVDRRKD